MGDAEKNVQVLYELQDSVLASDLTKNHDFVVEYYSTYNLNRELNHDFVRGNHYSPAELAKYKDKRKEPIVFNQVKSSERTILGMWLNSKYAVKFTSSSPASDDIGEILEQLNIWEADQQGDSMHDIDLVRQAWAGGNSFQECYMDVKLGFDPKMFTSNQNSFAIYWDPASRKLITREDARFVDRDSWMSYPDLQRNFPKKKTEIAQQMSYDDEGNNNFTDTKVYADRDHERRYSRNGMYMVTERFYKVPGKIYFVEMDDERVDIEEEDVKGFKEENPDINVQEEYAEMLYVAIACEEYDNSEYLYNGPYHCQPRDPRTKKVIWPILEMVAESLAGEPQGFVDHLRGPNKIVNAMMSNIVSSATHAAASAMLIDTTAFVSETEAKLAARHHSDSDRSFKVRKGRGDDAFTSIEHNSTNQDHQYALNFSLGFISEASSTPPALQGVQESASTPGVLNAQRIEQGATQLQPFMKNYRLFLKQRAKLRYYYWRTYNTKKMTFKVIDKTKPDMDPFMTINERVPVFNALGQWEGAIGKLNDINSAIYDISIEEALDSPTYRDKQLGFIERLLQSKFIEADPGLAAGLLEEALRLSDAPKKTREFLKMHSTLIQNAAMKMKQLELQAQGIQNEGSEIENEAKLQQVAQAEAEQTSLPPEMNVQPETYPEDAYASA